MSNKIIFIGAANPQIIKDIAAEMKAGRYIDVIGFLDNDTKKFGQDFYGYRILGPTKIAADFCDDDTRFVNLITGNTKSRLETTNEVIAQGGKFANFVHHGIDMHMVTIGIGNYIQEGVIIQANVVIGNNSSIHMGAKIGHETFIGSTTFIAHGVSVSGCCKIGSGVFVGTNATILPRLNIGDWAIVGAGAVVTRDVPAGAVVVGSPAKVIKFNDVCAAADELIPIK